MSGTTAPNSILTAHIGVSLNEHSMARMKVHGIREGHAGNEYADDRGTSDECRATLKYGLHGPGAREGRYKIEGWRVVLIHTGKVREC